MPCDFVRVAVRAREDATVPLVCDSALADRGIFRGPINFTRRHVAAIVRHLPPNVEPEGTGLCLDLM